MGIEILFVEDDARTLAMLRETAEGEGFDAEGVASAETALERLEAKRYDVVVTEASLPGMSGIELVAQLKRLRPGTPALVITDDGTVDLAVSAMKHGASDVLTKPLNTDVLVAKMRHAAGSATPPAATATRRPAAERRAANSIVAESPAMRKLLVQVAAIAPFNTTVLVTGETGTGKELIARTIHRQSTRHDKPLVALNCAAIPEHLLEDELFGHVKGAFTGAQTAREGRFEQADGGTLFLDEIGDMSLPLQSKLLRVLQEREFEKLGSSRTIKVDVRIIAATSADLERAMEEGRFRPDLFYRLNVVHLHLPPLHKRADDIRPLAEQLLKSFCDSVGLPPKQIDDAAWSALGNYYWPGNVRQLQNAMERAAALSGATVEINIGDLPEEVRGGAPSGISPALAARAAQKHAAPIERREPPPRFEPPRREPPSIEPEGEREIPDEGVNFDDVVTGVERELLVGALNKAGGNKMRAAKLLNMKRTTFVEKLKRLGINAEDRADESDAPDAPNARA